MSPSSNVPPLEALVTQAVTQLYIDEAARGDVVVLGLLGGSAQRCSPVRWLCYLTTVQLQFSLLVFTVLELIALPDACKTATERLSRSRDFVFCLRLSRI